MSYMDTWAFARDAYEGIGEFSDGTGIVKYPRESDDKYTARKTLASFSYENLLDSKVSRYVGYLLKTNPVRESTSNILDVILDDIDGSGNDIDIFFSTFARNMKVRGVNLLLIDSPTTLSDNLDDQIRNRELPYFVEILPERVTSYKLDRFGKFDYVAFTDTIDNSTYGNTEVIDIIRYYDKEQWAIYSTDGDILDRKPHGFVACPVLISSEKGAFESTGEFTQIAGMSKTLYNLQSELSELMRGQAFSLLTVWTEKGSQPELKVGTDSVLMYSGDHPPAFISADAAQANVYEIRMGKVREAIDRVAYDISTTNQVEAGIALEIKFEGLNSSLAAFAQRIESTERQAWWLVVNKLGLSPESITVSYNKEFGVSDTQKEIETLDALNNISDMPSYRAEKLKSIIKEDLKGADVQVINDIFTEIDNTVKINEI